MVSGLLICGFVFSINCISSGVVSIDSVVVFSSRVVVNVIKWCMNVVLLFGLFCLVWVSIGMKMVVKVVFSMSVVIRFGSWLVIENELVSVVFKIVVSSMIWVKLVIWLISVVNVIV